MMLLTLIRPFGACFGLKFFSIKKKRAGRNPLSYFIFCQPEMIFGVSPSTLRTSFLNCEE